MSSSIATVAVGGAVLLTAAALGALVRSVNRGLARSMEGSGRDAAVPSDHTASLAALRRAQAESERRVFQAASSHLPSLDAMKVAVLDSLHGAGYVLPVDALAAPVASLATAGSVAEVERARHALLRTAEASHLDTVARGVALACARAAETLGFVAEPSVRRDDTLHVVATDAAGRSLVSEVRLTREGAVALETEVIGVTDGSCHAVLDRFDAALEAEGVAGDRRRRSTGGVCELAGARAAASRLFAQGGSVGPASAPASPSTRRRAHRPTAVQKGRSR